MRVPFHRLSKLLACGRAAPRAVLTLALAVAACGGGAGGGELDQTDTSGVDIGETTDDGSPQDVVEDTDTSPEVDSDTSTVPDSDVSVETDDAEIDTTEAEVADETTTPPPDADQDGVPDTEDQCPEGRRDWTSSPSTDRDGDGCHDTDEDTDDDQDGVLDEDDACPSGAIGWTPDPDNDHDGDGCRDEDEDTDDDNDGIPDDLDECPRGANDWMSGPETDADGDGCRDADEDFDLDGDGVLDEVDVCPGLFDPEQIDAAPPFGPGEGDLCAEPCREYIRYPVIEVASLESYCGIRTLGGAGVLDNNRWIRFHDGPVRFPRFEYGTCSPFPGAFSYLGISRTDRSPQNDFVCHIQPIEVLSVAAQMPLRLEVSAGAGLSELSGVSNVGVLMFPAGSPVQDRDNDGLMEPWNPQNHHWASPTTTFYRSEFRLEKNDPVGSMTARALRLWAYGPDYAMVSAAYTVTTGVHIYLVGVLTSPMTSRVRMFFGEHLVSDIELPRLDHYQAVYLGEYFHEPQFFVQRKRCAVNNTLCASEADCPSGPCVFRTMTLDFTPRD